MMVFDAVGIIVVIVFLTYSIICNTGDICHSGYSFFIDGSIYYNIICNTGGICCSSNSIFY